jgi:hypothetical protein
MFPLFQIHDISSNCVASDQGRLPLEDSSPTKPPPPPSSPPLVSSPERAESGAPVVTSRPLV